MNFIETNFLVIASSLSETLLSAMDTTVAINTNREIEISKLHTLALLSMCQNTHYGIVTLITPFGSSIATMFVVSCILFALLSIIVASTSKVPQQCTSI